MRLALALARSAQGTTWPNPSVGCVLTQGARIVGQGATAAGGRPHAEAAALTMAGALAAGATAYITLEPCAHHGRTPPCADALVAAGIARAVIACTDPDPRTDGAGLARLRAAGVAVEFGPGAVEAGDILAGFFSRVRTGRPLVTLKLASTLDGRIATAAGESRWITGEAARRLVHAERGRHDAVLVGIGTALADAPDLRCRLPGFAPAPNPRVVADTWLRLPLDSPLVTTAGAAPLWVLHGEAADPVRRAALAARGVVCHAVPAGPGGLDIAAMLAALGAAGLTRVLVEGGAALAASLLAADLVDRLLWVQAPAVVGSEGLASVGPLGTATLAALRRFVPEARWQAGVDGMGVFTRMAPDVAVAAAAP